MISEAPYLFTRAYSKANYSDQVLIGLDLQAGAKELNVGNVFEDGTALRDAYSGTQVTVEGGKVRLETKFGIVLLERI